jgi:hypothetical protein
MNHLFERFFLIFLLAVSGLTAQTQNRSALSNAEMNLKRQVASIRLSDSDSLKAEMNGQFLEDLKSALLLEDSFEYPFDSLTLLSILTPPDKAFRLITWNLQVSGLNKFFGFLQVKRIKDKRPVIIELYDKSDSLGNYDQLTLGAGNWPGAVYYQVIPGKSNEGEKIYTLLGWHGINSLITARVIDVLSFSHDTVPQFGKAIFCTDSAGGAKRVIFKYSAKASMLLRYDEQQVITGKKWNPSKREFEFTSEKHPMITANRLVPADPQVEGQYEYYIPESDVTDGYIFKNGCWSVNRDIDARNSPKKGSKKY